MSNLDKMRDKVAKILRQAEDVAGTPEEAVFQAKAFELMAKYGIDEAQVDAAKRGLDVSDLRDAIKWTVLIEGKYAAAQMLLLHNLATALHSKTVYSKNKYSKELHMFVYGVPTHIERIKVLWAILQPQMMRLVETVRPDYDHSSTKRVYDYTTHEFVTKRTSGSGHLKSYRRSWIAGFGSAVGERLRVEETKALESDDSGALVLFKGDVERADVALREAHPRLGRGTSSRVNGAGYAHGQRDGRNASFNHALAG
jgi:hypothetical protein